MPKPYFRSCSESIRSAGHPCPNHTSVRVGRAYDDQSIRAQTIIPFVFREHTVSRASMPKPYFRSCSESIRSEEHPCPNHNCVGRAYADQSAQKKRFHPLWTRHVSVLCSCAEQPVNPRAREPANPRTREPVNPRTREPVNPRTREPANPCTREPANPCTREPANPRTREPANPRTREPANPRTREPANP